MKNAITIITALLIISFLNTAYASTQLIIKFKPSQAMLSANLTQQQIRNQLMKPLNDEMLYNLSLISGIEFYDIKPIAVGGRVIATKANLSPVELKEVLAKLKKLNNIEYVEPDVKGQLASTTGLLNLLQWDMTSTSIFGNLTYYGNYFTGKAKGTVMTSVPVDYGSGVIVAVVDTGYTPHPNFINNLVPLIPGSNQYGYQFLTTCGEAGTCAPGENPDTLIPFQADALDQGNGKDGSPSDWHGTHIIGTIAASGYNSYLVNKGVTGGAPSAKILPVRVGGIITRNSTLEVMLSDVINGIMWAGGNHVEGARDNYNPAQVINLSLGFPIACNISKSLQDAINILHKDNINIVAAAMNNSEDTKNWAPANCPNVISVAAVGPTQKLTFYSDYGQVTISAAGGDDRFSNGQIYSTICNDTYRNLSCNHNDNSNFGWAYKEGTSMAAPHVCAAIAALLGKFPRLNPNQVIDILQKSATPYIKGDNCNANGCVTSGILNTEAAINYARKLTSGTKSISYRN